MRTMRPKSSRFCARFIFDAKSDAPDFLGRQNGRARTCELIEHAVATPRAIEKRISDERDGLYRRMGGQRLHAASPEGVDARVGPNVGAIATETAQFDIVSVGMAANPEDADEFMLREAPKSHCEDLLMIKELRLPKIDRVLLAVFPAARRRHRCSGARER
jgi:hypothetical protein